ncbi:transcriptional regulator slyA [Actinoplanes sp. SE50]|uniref:MarR family winged helix-turn-helix transcriptional regulator n=1 Tax=unclassified Actinoplanes TaxID=2626549 RepID=UPI00023ECB38|nr:MULTISPECIES: MarR family winged helix-turn-helix transcriptional regulator [unclassified Actinoplanes]AEV84801.1 Transcriptional regulator slyA [Actinoplanes sp. SE50/110]ATO83193.1 transcriptional regulator slyA [Actinoplanes sp. SE50]SLM00600.1 MarR family transcriptional regulator [Actinoplanes sp. SE50/110]
MTGPDAQSRPGPGPDPGTESMTRPDSGPMLSPGFWLHHAALTWRAELDARLRPLGLTPTQFMLLASAGWLEHVSGPPTQQQVADEAGADRMMTSRVVRTLQERGLLTRSPDPASPPSLRLSLTDAGRAVTRQATRAARDVDTLIFGDAAPHLRTSLRQIAESGGPTRVARPHRPGHP